MILAWLFSLFFLLLFLSPFVSSASPVCSIESVSNLASSLGSQYLSTMIGPGLRLRSMADTLLYSWQQNSSLATIEEIYSRLIPIRHDFNYPMTLNQKFVNISDASDASEGWAIVDLFDDRTLQWYNARFGAGGANRLDIACLSDLIRTGKANYDTLSPLVYTCIRPVNIATECAAHPSRCSAFQNSLPRYLRTAALSWRFTRPLQSLFIPFYEEFPYIAPSYLDETGTFAYYGNPSLETSCFEKIYPTLPPNTPPSICKKHSIVSLFNTDMFASTALALPYANEWAEQGFSPSFAFWNPPLFNKRRADLMFTYEPYSKTQVLVSAAALQVADAGLTTVIETNIVLSVQLVYKRLRDAIFDTASVNTSALLPGVHSRWFSFLSDSNGVIYLAEESSISVAMCSLEAAARRRSAGNYTVSTTSGCRSDARHQEYYEAVYSKLWNIGESEHASIRALKASLRPATASEYSSTTATMDGLLKGELPQPFLSTVDRVIVDGTPYIIAKHAYAVRSYLTLYYFLGIPDKEFLSKQAVWRFGSSNNLVIEYNPEIDDGNINTAQGYNVSFTLINEGALDIPFVFAADDVLGLFSDFIITPSSATITGSKKIKNNNSSSLSITIHIPRSSLLKMLDIPSISFSFAPEPRDGGLCVRPLTASLSVAWKWQSSIRNIPVAAQGVFWSGSAIIGIVVICAIGWTIYNRDAKHVKAGTWFASVSIQIHLLLLLIASALFLRDPDNDTICSGRAWLLGLGSCGSMLPLAIRMWRIRKIFDQTKLKVQRISHWQVFVAMVIMEALIILLLALTIHINDNNSPLSSTLTPYSDDSKRHIHYSVYECRRWQLPLAVSGSIAGLLTIICTHLAWKTKSVPGSFNDAIKVVAFDIFAMAFAGVILPIQFMLNDVVLVAALRAGAILFIVALYFLLLFTPLLDHFLEIKAVEVLGGAGTVMGSSMDKPTPQMGSMIDKQDPTDRDTIVTSHFPNGSMLNNSTASIPTNNRTIVVKTPPPAGNYRVSPRLPIIENTRPIIGWTSTDSAK